MNKLARIAPLLLLLVCTLFVAETRADPVVITGGSAALGSALGGPVMLVGGGLTLNAGLSQGLFNGNLFQQGQAASLRSFNLGLDIGSGPVTLNGVNYSQVFYQGQMEFLGGLGPLTGPLGAFTLQTPFSFTSTLQGCLTSWHIGPCAPGNLVFDTTILTGQGTATVELIGFELAGGRHFQISRVNYNFAPAAVPEPATLLLLGTGLAGVTAAARKRKRRIEGVASSQ